MKGGIFGVWTPDGSRLLTAWRKDSDVGQDIYSIPVAGGEPTRVVASDYPLWPSSVSADGRWLVFVESNPGTGNDIWIAGLHPSVPARPLIRTPANEAFPVISPDGRLLAYASSEGGAPEVYVQPFPETGRRVQISKGGGGTPSWMPDGRSLVYRGPDGRLLAAAIDPADPSRADTPGVFSKARVRTSTPVGFYSVSRDGSMLVTVDEDAPAEGAARPAELQLEVHALARGGVRKP